MDGRVDWLQGVERALDDVRFAQALLTRRVGADQWCGPARSGFDAALHELPPLVRSAESALERERGRVLLLPAVEG